MMACCLLETFRSSDTDSRALVVATPHTMTLLGTSPLPFSLLTLTCIPELSPPKLLLSGPFSHCSCKVTKSVVL